MKTTITTTVIGLGALLASACASTSDSNTYQSELTELRQTCEARGGILSPTGLTTGRPATEYACEIRNPSRINRN